MNSLVTLFRLSISCCNPFWLLATTALSSAYLMVLIIRPPTTISVGGPLVVYLWYHFLYCFIMQQLFSAIFLTTRWASKRNDQTYIIFRLNFLHVQTLKFTPQSSLCYKTTENLTSCCCTPLLLLLLSITTFVFYLTTLYFQRLFQVGRRFSKKNSGCSWCESLWAWCLSSHKSLQLLSLLLSSILAVINICYFCDHCSHPVSDLIYILEFSLIVEIVTSKVTRKK